VGECSDAKKKKNEVNLKKHTVNTILFKKNYMMPLAKKYTG
jgi:hypothetical protein